MVEHLSQVFLGFHKDIHGERFTQLSTTLGLPTEFNRARRGWFEMPFAELSGRNFVKWFMETAADDDYWELPEVETNAARIPDAGLMGLSDEEREKLAATFQLMLAALNRTHGFIHITFH